MVRERIYVGVGYGLGLGSGDGFRVIPGDEFIVRPGDEFRVIPGDGFIVRPGDGFRVIPGDKFIVRPGGFFGALFPFGCMVGLTVGSTGTRISFAYSSLVHTITSTFIHPTNNQYEVGSS